jgi:hypothetical protein
MNTERTISINPQFLNISKKKMKMIKPQLNENINTNEVKLNTNNIRQLLLDRLRQHKKKKTQKFPIQLNTMDEQINLETIEHHIPLSKFNTPKEGVIICSNNFDSISNKIQEISQPTIQSNSQVEKPYGNLKNGIKPTFKSWTNKDSNVSESISNIHTPQNIFENIISKSQDNFENIIPEPLSSIIEKKEIKKTFNIGKNKKENAISILIKNNCSRKKIESDKLALKKTSLSTLKNFLKKQNLIKFGSTAPNQLLREIYENTKLCGDIINENPQNILHNFKET